MSVVRTDILSHGTLDVRDAEKSANFYSEFLGLEVRINSSRSMWILKKREERKDLFLVCVGVGDKLKPQSRVNRYILDFATKEEIHRAHDLAVEYKDTYQISTIEPVISEGEGCSLILQDLDQNWWELKYQARAIFENAFNGRVLGPPL
jgi:predicted lactoylglutathione lyase